MESAEHRLAARARRAYEIGRLRWATRVAWVVLLLIAVSFAAVGGSPVSAATGALLLVTATALRWRGGPSSTAAVRAGLTGMAWMLMGELVATLPAFAVELRRR